jgi:hypothetical protein
LSANGEVDLRANASSSGTGRQASSLILELNLVALHVANVVVGLSVLSANRGDVTQTVQALLVGDVLTSSLKGLNNHSALNLTSVQVVPSVSSANWFVKEGTVAWSVTD